MATLHITHDGFHGITRTSVRLSPGETRLSPGQAQKLDRVACGISDCRCGESILRTIADSREPWEWGEWTLYAWAAETAGKQDLSIDGNYPQNR